MQADYKDAANYIRPKYASVTIKTSKRKWNLDKYKNAYADVTREIAECIVETYQSYLKSTDNKNPAGTYHKYPAMGRGESDPSSLFNALVVGRNPDNPTGSTVEVCNEVWWYQEYGFKMNSMPSRRVAEKLLDWAVDKGFLEQLKSGEDREEHGTRAYKKFRIRKAPGAARLTGYYKPVTEYDLQKERIQGRNPEIERIMWKLATAVYVNSREEDNKRLFLTLAYHNVMSDRELIKRIEIDQLTKHGLR